MASTPRAATPTRGEFVVRLKSINRKTPASPAPVAGAMPAPPPRPRSTTPGRVDRDDVFMKPLPPGTVPRARTPSRTAGAGAGAGAGAVAGAASATSAASKDNSLTDDLLQ